MHLILLRHGQSVWNLENRFTGWCDIDLTQTGEIEAQQAGLALVKWTQLSGNQIGSIFTSTLKRAQHTTNIVCKVMENAGVDLDHLYNERKQLWQEDAALNERDYGDLTGLNKAEVADRYGFEQVQIWRRSYNGCPPGGESLADVVKRIQPWAETHLLTNKQDQAYRLIIAHGNSLRALLMIIGVYKERGIAEIEIPTGRPFLISFKYKDNSHPWEWKELD